MENFRSFFVWTEHFCDADCASQPQQRCLSCKAGIVRCCLRRTRLSSILCVRLRPSAGWLQGSLCRRFLLPPAFHFAGAEVLPGSGLGNRSAVDRGTRSVQTPSVPLSTGGTTLSAAPVRWASHPGAGTVARNCCISPGRSARPV